MVQSISSTFGHDQAAFPLCLGQLTESSLLNASFLRELKFGYRAEYLVAALQRLMCDTRELLESLQSLEVNTDRDKGEHLKRRKVHGLSIPNLVQKLDSTDRAAWTRTLQACECVRPTSSTSKCCCAKDTHCCPNFLDFLRDCHARRRLGHQELVTILCDHYM